LVEPAVLEEPVEPEPEEPELDGLEPDEEAEVGDEEPAGSEEVFDGFDDFDDEPGSEEDSFAVFEPDESPDESPEDSPDDSPDEEPASAVVGVPRLSLR
jgi:hypothetical protein